MSKIKVLVLGGGPDGEREVSINSATEIADALKAGGTYDVRLEIIDTLTAEQLKALPGDVILPYLHGPWGEGGPLQDLLESDGRPFVGCGAQASRIAMDKVATKMIGLKLGLMTPPSFILNLRDAKPPLKPPIVVKPVHEGSTLGLHMCMTREDFDKAREAIRAEVAKGLSRPYMVEPRVAGREITVGVIDSEALPAIEIIPANGLYDYEAKYTRDDTKYIVAPPLPAGLGARLADASVRLMRSIQGRHISRVDYIVDDKGTPWLLEINTTPGFTSHSLVPKAAAHAGITMPVLCERLVGLALRDHDRTSDWLGAAGVRG
jgi:D-alanine-D-alanine ligase